MTDEDRIDQEGVESPPDYSSEYGAEAIEAEEAADVAPPESEFEEPSGPPMKRCVCCGAVIPLPALNCSQCRSWVSLWEGSIAKEYFYLLAAALTCVFGTLLPWKPIPDVSTPGYASEVAGINYMSGAVIFIFSVICALTCLYNIRSKRLLFWPILLLLVENAFVLAVYFMTWTVNVGGEARGFIDAMSWAYDDGSRGEGGIQGGLWSIYRLQGIGVYFVMVGTLFILVQIIMSVIKAASKGQPKKPQPAAGRGRRR